MDVDRAKGAHAALTAAAVNPKHCHKKRSSKFRAVFCMRNPAAKRRAGSNRRRELSSWLFTLDNRNFMFSWDFGFSAGGTRWRLGFRTGRDSGAAPAILPCGRIWVVPSSGWWLSLRIPLGINLNDSGVVLARSAFSRPPRPKEEEAENHQNEDSAGD